MCNFKGFEDCNINIVSNINNLTEGGYLVKIQDTPNKGFYYPYLVFIPKNVNTNSTIIVEGANTVDGTKQLFELNNKEIINESVNGVKEYFNAGHPIKRINEQITNYPFLYPLFPRLRYHGESYWNHMLSSNSMFNKENEEILKKLGIYRTDLQLVEMIKDAKKRLIKYGLNIDDKVIMYGFSASAKFVNRFTLLHPEIVKLTFAAALGGAITLPIRELNGEKLIWPIGIGNVNEIDDEKLEVYKNVPQYYFHGTRDKNDCYEANNIGTCRDNDILKDDEAVQLYRIFGKNMNNRWDITNQIISSLDCNITLVTCDETHNPFMANEMLEEKLSEIIKDKRL